MQETPKVEVIESIYDNITVRGKEYYTYLQETERVKTMKTALNRFSLLRKDMEKGRGDKITLAEFADYVRLSPEFLRKILKL